MNKNLTVRVFHWVAIAAIIFALSFMPVLSGKVGAASLQSTPADIGYIDHTYGVFDTSVPPVNVGVKAEPSADGAESKVWFNDGIWWGILFNPATELYEIYRLDWATQNWTSTGTFVDSRKDVRNDIVSTTVDTRADVLWDQAAGKLYIASHMKVDNPAKTTNDDFWAYLNRYSYSSGTKTYTLDNPTPALINSDRTEVLVLDKDSKGRLWVTYVSRVPTSDDFDIEPYQVYVNYTTTPGLAGDFTWATAIDLSEHNGAGNQIPATVAQTDAATIIAYNPDKVGVLWSNTLTGKFYFAEHNANNGPTTGWTVTGINNIPGLTPNDHLKLVTNSAGQVFSAIKTINDEFDDPTLPGVGVLARDTNGTFSFHEFSKGPSKDTRPTLALNESNNTLHLFMSSGENGGAICHDAAQITSPLANMAFTQGPCTNDPGADNHFIESSVYHNLDNSTTTKRNFTTQSGLVVMASDDTNGSVYLHNVIQPIPVVVNPAVDVISPVNGANLEAATPVITAHFTKPMNQATVQDPANFIVTGPSGVIGGTITYNPATQTATFTGTGTQPVGTLAFTVKLTTGMKDTDGTALVEKNWQFNLIVTAEPVVLKYIYLPTITR